MWMDTFLLRKKGEDEIPAFWIARIFCSFIYSFIFIFSWMDFVFYTMLRSLNVYDISFHERMYWIREKIEA